MMQTRGGLTICCSCFTLKMLWTKTTLARSHRRSFLSQKFAFAFSFSVVRRRSRNRASKPCLIAWKRAKERQNEKMDQIWKNNLRRLLLHVTTTPVQLLRRQFSLLFRSRAPSLTRNIKKVVLHFRRKHCKGKRESKDNRQAAKVTLVESNSLALLCAINFALLNVGGHYDFASLRSFEC